MAPLSRHFQIVILRTVVSYEQTAYVGGCSVALSVWSCGPWLGVCLNFNVRHGTVVIDVQYKIEHLCRHWEK